MLLRSQSRIPYADFAIDLGTRNLLISDNQRILFNQPSLISYPKHGRGGCIIGERAAEILKRNFNETSAASPLASGVICDLNACSHLIETALRTVSRWRFRRPRLLITHPLDITPLELRMFREAAENTNPKEVVLIPEPTAYAAGISRSFLQDEAIFVLDIGAGITEAVLFSHGKVLAKHSARIGGDTLETAIVNHVKARHRFRIAPNSAFDILNQLAYHRNEAFLQPIRLTGKNLEFGFPGELHLEVGELETCLDPLFLKIVDVAMQVLDTYPPDLSEALMDSGIRLTGGASRYPRLKELFQKRIQLPLIDDDQPLLGVARGEIQTLQDPKIFDFLAQENQN